MNEIPYGYCYCGCGQKTNVVKYNDKYSGLIRGNPRKFIKGHQSRIRIGDKHPLWKGGVLIDTNGYELVNYPGHHRAGVNGYVKKHILVCEESFGRPLLPTEAVHHINENKLDNSIGNLIVFKKSIMHTLFHHRLLAFKSCGHWDWKKCWHCKQWDDPVNLINLPRKHFHLECEKQYIARVREHRNELQRIRRRKKGGR